MSYYDIKGFHPQDYYHYEQQRPSTGPSTHPSGSRTRDDADYVELHSLQQLQQQRLHSGSMGGSSGGVYTPAPGSTNGSAHGNANSSGHSNGSVNVSGQRLFLGPASSHRHSPPGAFPEVDYEQGAAHPANPRSGAVHSSPNKYYHHQQQYQSHYEQSDMDDDDAAVGIYEDIDVSDNDTNSEVYLQAYRSRRAGKAPQMQRSQPPSQQMQRQQQQHWAQPRGHNPTPASHQQQPLGRRR